MLTPPDKRLALQAYEQVLDLIMSRRIAPGTLLQERRLAEHLQMSRTPLRDALLMLEGEGLLIRQGSKGLQVKSMNVQDFIENLAVRKLLEPEAARLASGRIDREHLDSLAERLAEMIAQASSSSGAPDRGDVRAIDDELHSAITEAAGNAQMAQIIRTLRRQTQIFDLRSVPERFEATCREHLAIVEALRDNRAEDAANAMRTHLDGVRQSIIARLTGA
ncbi:GntR family transcriptional regulator [Terrarubrum flagellatum]|uniref:GntR family transcriptional regulator n=1 Tax=Terrirubrum flagellatum TaxID=2895980 RepID=UPI003145407B